MTRPFKVLAVHKQMYPATYNFRDEADGTCGTDIDFLDTANHAGANNSICIVSDFVGHRKVLKITDATATDYTEYEHDIGSTETDTIIEFWWAVSQIASSDGAKFVCFEGATEICGLYITTTGLHTYNPGADNIKLAFIVADTYFHIKMILDDTANTFDCYINGVLEGTFNYRNNTTTGINKIRVGSGFDDIINIYFDAMGFSWDTDYNISDNVHWRHYFDQDSNFESEDVGTTGLSIDFVDTVTDGTEVTIISEFNEHKKILENADVGGSNVVENDIIQRTSGIVEFWYKSNDVTERTNIQLTEDAEGAICYLQMSASELKYYDGAVLTATGLTMVNDTWYHIKLQFYGDDTYDYWIDNIQYADGVDTRVPMGSGVDLFILGTYIHTDYIDSVSYSWNNEVADDRIFDYNSVYTSKDITTDVKNVLYKNEIYKWREAILLSEKVYENSEVFFQVYDVNSKLALESEIKNRAQISKDYKYTLRDKNQDDLEHRSNNTFSANKIHDPTDSTSILKTILPNISEADGDLILVDADTKTDTYSPTTQNYPDYIMLRDISDLADSVVIVHADGKCYLDDDKASGTVLDLDTVADKDNMTAPPLVTDILENINYFEIFGAMNPETGVRFFKIIDNTGNDKKRSWRYTNNVFKSQTDVDNYATSLNNRTTTIKNIKFTAQSLGSHNMGETIDYKFIDTLYNIPQNNYYIIYEEIDFDANENVIILSEGMIEDSKYAATYEKPENYNDSYAAEIFETDIAPVPLYLSPRGGATIDTSGGINMNAINDIAFCSFFTSPNIDATRPITIYYSFSIIALAGDGAINVIYHTYRRACDCTAVGASDVFLVSPDLSCTTASRLTFETKTIIASKVFASTQYWIEVQLNDVPPADLTLLTVTIQYYLKRSV